MTKREGVTSEPMHDRGATAVPWKSELSALAIVAGLFAAFAVGVVPDTVPLETLTRDAAAVALLPWHTGALSNLGAVVWASASAVALFTGLVAGGRQQGLLIGFGGLGVALGLDDLLLIHEEALPRLFGDLAEPALIGGYGLVAVLTLVMNRDRLLGPGTVLFAGGLGLLGSSVLVDLVVTAPTSIEDALKLVGIFGWSAGLLYRSRHALLGILHAEELPQR